MRERSSYLFRLVMAFAVPLAVTACQPTGNAPPRAAWDHPQPGPPGADSPFPALHALTTTLLGEEKPKPVEPPLSLLPQNQVAAPAAIQHRPADLAAALANDPEAQRFLLLLRLVNNGLITPEEALSRRNANLGALLPFSAPPPAVDLGRPVPADDVVSRLTNLNMPGNGPASSRAAERGFLLDSVLPLSPRTRAAPVRTDAEALVLGRQRLDAMDSGGLVTADEREREEEAISRAERALAALPPPPPPPPPEPPKKPRKAKSKGPTLRPGDVPGGAIPGTGNGPMAIHLLSMASEGQTETAIVTLKKDYPELAALEFKAVKTVIPELGTTYRLIAGPLPSTEAEALCTVLRVKGQSCAVTRF